MNTAKDRLARDDIDEDVLKERASFLAMCVRAAIENLHSTGAITDATMAQLNPLVRNAILTGLTAIEDFPFSKESIRYVEGLRMIIPDFWEEPVVLPGSGLNEFTDATPDLNPLLYECPACGAAPQEQCCRGGNPKHPMEYPHGKRFSRGRAARYAFIERFKPL